MPFGTWLKLVTPDPPTSSQVCAETGREMVSRRRRFFMGASTASPPEFAAQSKNPARYLKPVILLEMRPDPDTTLGGAQKQFPSTCWSRFLAGASGGPPGHAAF